MKRYGGIGRPICRLCGAEQAYDIRELGRFWRVGTVGTVPVLSVDGVCRSCDLTRTESA